MKSAVRHALGACLLLSAWSAEAKTYTVTATTFKSVFAKVASGDTILLKGNFGSATLKSRIFTTAVTIDARAATFAGTLRYSGVTGVTVLGCKYDSTTATVTGIAISGGSRITLTNPVVVGNRGKSHGIDVTSATNVSITGGTFTGLRAGVSFTGVTGGVLSGNKSLASTSDGFDIAGSRNISITGNSCSGTVASAGAHPDCVQLWNVAGRPTQSDITISGNTATGATQGFTSFDDGNRIKMTNNRVDITYTQAIACYSCTNGVFTDNVITTQKGARWVARVNIIGGSNNTVANNSVGPMPANGLAFAGTARMINAFDAAGSELGNMESVAFTRLEGGISEAGMPSWRGAAVDGIDDLGGEVPEPAAWVMLITGFGLVGTALRRRRQVSVSA